MYKTNPIKQISHYIQSFISVPQATLIGMKKRAYGVDMARYQVTFNPDTAVPGLLDFGIVKATEGTSYKDPAFESLYVGVAKLLGQGAYHYLKSNASGVSQANWFLETTAGKHLDMQVIDFEGYGNVMDDAFVKVLYDALVQVSTARPQIKTILYTNSNFYDTIIYPAAMRLWGRDVFLDFDLWIAQYPYVVNVDGEPVMPKKRADWKLWQFSSTGSAVEHGTGGRVDRNVFNGSVAEFSAWLNVAPPVPPEEIVMRYFEIKNAMNIRATPAILSTNDIGDLLTGDKVEISETVQVTANDQWGKLAKITRGAVNIPLPAAVCYLSLNTTGTVEIIPVSNATTIAISYDAANVVSTVTVDGVAFKK
jgi:lysozyme